MLQEGVFEAGEEKTGWEREGSDLLDPLNAYLSEISTHPVLSREEELEVSERACRHNDAEARKRLVTSNLRLVVKIALEYHSPHLNLLDAIQEGNMGLVHATKKFDPARGARFSTYSSFWVRAYILKYLIETWSLVKIGTTQAQRRLFFGLHKEKKRLEARGVTPSPQILARILRVRVGEVEEMEKRLAYGDISLEAPIDEEGEYTIGETLEADDSVEEAIVGKEKREILEDRIAKFKKTLNHKELVIFEQRIAREERSSLQEIGDHFGVSKERVRQLEHRVFKKFSDQYREEMRNL